MKKSHSVWKTETVMCLGGQSSSYPDRWPPSAAPQHLSQQRRVMSPYPVTTGPLPHCRPLNCLILNNPGQLSRQDGPGQHGFGSGHQRLCGWPERLSTKEAGVLDKHARSFPGKLRPREAGLWRPCEKWHLHCGSGGPRVHPRKGDPAGPPGRGQTRGCSPTRESCVCGMRGGPDFWLDRGLPPAIPRMRTL